MQISLKWINELIKIETVGLDELINKLTLGGFEVEEVLEIEINNQLTIVLDISATANRSDSLSISGLALEMAALLKNNIKISNYRTKNFFWSKKVQAISPPVLTTLSCSDFIGVTIQNLTKQTSPNWMKQKLIVSGINPENSLIDFQNYVLLELGYPFEFYDLDKISTTLNTSDFKLHLSYDNDSEKFSASNGLDYKLDKSILTLKANHLPLSIAGIISNEKFCHSKKTTSLLVEASIFKAAAIRRQSRMLGIRTNRSSRYEKSINNTNLLEALYRLISLLRLTNPDLTCKLHTLSHSPEFKVKTISLNYQNINRVLGPITQTSKKNYDYISPNLIEDSLRRLQFNIQPTEEQLTWAVTVPSFRSDDIIQEIDIIEEIGRLYGFNNFLTRLPNIQRVGKKDLNYQMRKKITSCLINLGFNELIQYSLVNETNYIENEISLLNPLINDYSKLRSSLLPHLVKTAQDNIKKSNLILEGFEYGHIFYKNNLNHFQEKEVISGIFGGIKNKSSWSDSSQFLSWFEAKGKIEQLFSNLNLNVYWSQDRKGEQTNIFHLSRVANISVLHGQRLGVFGQINPILARQLNLSSDLYLFEFDFELIEKMGQQNQLAIYQDYSSYPKIIKDLSFIINNQICFEEIKKVLSLNGSKFLVNLTLLDEYRGVSIPENSTSLCLQLTFQSKQTTLQNKTVETIINNLKTILITKFNAIIRD